MLLFIMNVMSFIYFYPMVSRLDSEDDQVPDKLQHFRSKTDTPTPAEGHGDNNESTKTEEPNTSQPGQTECKYHTEET